MKILETFQSNFKVLGLGSHRLTQKYQLNRENAHTIIIFCSLLILCIIYFFNGANTFQEYAFVTYVISTEMLLIVLYLICLWKNHEICILLNNVGRIIDERLIHPASAGNYVKVVLQADLWTRRIHFLFMKILRNVLVIPIATYSYYIYYTTDMETDAFVLPIPLWLPFQWKSPFGYSIAVTIQYLGAVPHGLFAAALISFEIGLYFMLVELIKDIKHNMRSISKRKITKLKERRLRMKQRLCSSIQFHSNVKQQVLQMAAVIEQMLSAECLWSIITDCGGMLIFQSQISKGTLNLVTLIVPLIVLIYPITVVFISCELFGRLTNEFDKINDVINQYGWYSFPTEVQHMLPLIMMHAQKPVSVNCFGGIPCNRETFKKVMNSAFSYFMVLRRFGI